MRRPTCYNVSMKTGISTASFFLRQECEEAIAAIGGLGAQCAEVFLGSFYEYRPEFARKVVQTFAERTEGDRSTVGEGFSGNAANGGEGSNTANADGSAMKNADGSDTANAADGGERRAGELHIVQPSERPFGDMEVTSVHALSSNFEPQLFSSSRRVRGDAFYWLDQIMRSANILKAKKYTFHGLFGHAAHGAGRKDLGSTAEYLNGAIEFCARYGVELCLENVCWCLYNRPGVFAELKERCPSLRGVLDLKQARRSGYPAQMYIEDMRGCISHVHLSDVTAEGRLCLPGKGVTDFSELFKRLAGAGFDGELIIETYSDDYSDLSELKTSLEYISELACKQG